MLGTGVRCGELIGLTWEDVDVRTKAVSIDHQLIYKDLGDGYKFHISTPKTDSGIRTIPMTSDVQRAFEEQKKLNFMFQKGKDVEIDGYKGFIFMANPVKSRFAKKSQKISTHLLTWLKTACYIISRTKEDREKDKK